MDTKQSCAFICRVRRRRRGAPSRGTRYATMTICGIRATGNEFGLLTPSKDSLPAAFDTIAFEHGKKMNIATIKQMNEITLPQVALRGRTRIRSVACTAVANRDTTPTNFPIDIAADTFFSQRRFQIDAAMAGEAFDGGRRGQAGKLLHQSSTRALHHGPTSHLRSGGWGGSIKKIRS